MEQYLLFLWEKTQIKAKMTGSWVTKSLPASLSLMIG